MKAIAKLARLQWDRGTADMWAAGGMLHNLSFDLGNGKHVSPLAEAPWHTDPDIMGDESIAAHLRHLGGEWPCVPFGRTATDPFFHGFGSDHAWSLTSATDGAVSLAIDYPQTHPVSRLERTVRGVPGKAAVDFTISVFARTECHLPAGLHPNFEIPQPGEPFAVEAAFAYGETFPAEFERGVSRLAVGKRFDTLDALPLADGSTGSLAELAWKVTEEAAQVFQPAGRVTLSYPARGYRAHLDWDPNDFPTCLFWLSASGRSYRPWGGRFRGMGVEPLAIRFGSDGTGLPGPGNGTRHFRAGEVWTARYRISAEAIGH